MNNAKNMIETAIVNLINDFKNYPDKYLTEIFQSYMVLQMKNARVEFKTI